MDILREEEARFFTAHVVWTGVLWTAVHEPWGTVYPEWLGIDILVLHP